MINMSWREVLKEESARDYVLNRASSGKPMGDALREFAQKFCFEYKFFNHRVSTNLKILT